MGLLVTVAVVLVAWCALALVVGVVIGRAIALTPRGGQHAPEPGHAPSPSRGASLSVSYRERLRP